MEKNEQVYSFVIFKRCDLSINDENAIGRTKAVPRNSLFDTRWRKVKLVSELYYQLEFLFYYNCSTLSCIKFLQFCNI